MNEVDAKRLLALNEEELMLGLGRALSRERFLQPQDPRRYIADAKKWLDDNWATIREKVCGSGIIQKILKNKTMVDDTSLTITVFSLFSGVLEPAIAALVSGLVVRRGLTSVCGVM